MRSYEGDTIKVLKGFEYNMANRLEAMAMRSDKREVTMACKGGKKKGGKKKGY